MLVIVGHGPGVVGKHLGPWLDTQTVVRLKWAEIPNAEDWGSRTDYLCGSTPSFYVDRTLKKLPKLDVEFWYLPHKQRPEVPGLRQASQKWTEYFKTFEPAFPKASTGLRAVFCAIEFLAPAEIGLLGFDRILHPDVPTSKWWHEVGKYHYGHDAHAEHRCLMSLGVKITEL